MTPELTVVGRLRGFCFGGNSAALDWKSIENFHQNAEIDGGSRQLDGGRQPNKTKQLRQAEHQRRFEIEHSRT
jgi:hypothetical protein